MSVLQPVEVALSWLEQKQRLVWLLIMYQYCTAKVSARSFKTMQQKKSGSLDKVCTLSVKTLGWKINGHRLYHSPGSSSSGCCYMCLPVSYWTCLLVAKVMQHQRYVNKIWVWSMVQCQTARTNPNYLQKDLSQCHFLHHSHNTLNIPYIILTYLCCIPRELETDLDVDRAEILWWIR